MLRVGHTYLTGAGHTRRHVAPRAASDFIFQARPLYLRTAGLGAHGLSHLKDQVAKQSSGKLGVRTAHFAEGEDEEIQISLEIQAAGLPRGRILKHLRGRAKHGFERVRSRQCQGFPGIPGGFHPQSGVSRSLNRSTTIEKEASFL